MRYHGVKGGDVIMTLKQKKIDIRKIRMQIPMTQSAMSAMLEVPMRTWQRFEQYEYVPPAIYKLLRLKLREKNMLLGDGGEIVRF